MGIVSLLDNGWSLKIAIQCEFWQIRIGCPVYSEPEDSEFTSIQERLKDYTQQQRADSTKQSTKLSPFVRSKGNKVLNRIDFDEEDYYRLVDWTGRAIRDDKRGAIPEELEPIIERLKLNPDAWLKSIKYYNRDYFTAVGAIDRIKAYAQSMEKCWFQGQSAAKSYYRLVVVG